MKRSLSFLVTAALAAGAGAHGASGQTLQGRVIDTTTEAPLGGSTMRLMTPDSQAVASTISDDGGGFALRAPSPGEYLVRVERLGYQTSVLGPLRLRAAGFLEVTIALGLSAIPVDPLSVEVEGRDRTLEQAGFYDRRQKTAGQFLDRQEIEALHVQRASELMNTFRGVRVVRAEGVADVQVRGAPASAFSGQGSPCYAPIYLDGVLIAALSRGAMRRDAVNLDQLMSDDLEAVEVYAPAAVPVQFARDGAPCGAVVIWRRR